MLMILVDVNIFMDVFERRNGWTRSLEVINRVRQKKIAGHVSALTYPLLWFHREKFYSEEEAKKDVQEITKEFEVIALSRSVIENSLKSAMRDFEDGLKVSSELYGIQRAHIARWITAMKGLEG